MNLGQDQEKTTRCKYNPLVDSKTLVKLNKTNREKNSNTVLIEKLDLATHSFYI